MFAALKTRDYRLLWAGQGISHLGDQFHLIALPWLVLTLSHDPVQLGIAMALAGIPRAVLMLVGGAFADRHSPRAIMLVSDALRLVLTAGLALAVLTGGVRMWMVYVLAFAFGVVSGFFTPAAEAALPRLLESEHLEGGNALMMGVSQLAQFLGPAAAGVLIAVFGASTGATRAAGLTGIGVAFAIDAASFAVSALTLWAMRPLPGIGAGDGNHPLHAVLEGLRFAASIPAYRWMLGLVGAANLLLMGPLTVGVPVLAKAQFAQGAAAYGLFIAAYGLGNLGGMVGGGSLGRPDARAFNGIVVGLFVAFGVVIGSIAFMTSTWMGCAMFLALGLGNGYVAVILMSTLQRITPEHMLGRLMSLVMLAMLGGAPLSQALTGFALKAGPRLPFVAAGVAIAAVGLIAGGFSRSWSLEMLEEGTAAAVAAAETA